MLTDGDDFWDHFFGVLLIFNAEYLLTSFLVDDVKDLMSLIAIAILFRSFSIQNDRCLQVYKFTVLMSIYNLLNFVIYSLVTTSLYSSAPRIIIVQLLLLISIFFLCLRKTGISTLLIALSMFIKVLEIVKIIRQSMKIDGESWKIYEDKLEIHLGEAEAVLMLSMCWWTASRGEIHLFPLRADDKQHLRDGGLLGLMQHKLRITESFPYFAFYVFISTAWNLVLKKAILHSLLQVFGMTCLIWTIASSVLYLYQFALPTTFCDKFRKEILQLDFFTWFLVAALHERMWRSVKFETKMNEIWKSLVVLAFYVFASHRSMLRMLAGDGAKHLRPYSLLMYGGNFIFAVAFIVYCLRNVVARTAYVLIIFAFSLQLACNMIEDQLVPRKAKSFKRRYNYVINLILILILAGDCIYNMATNGWFNCFDLVNDLWMHQIYVISQRL